MPVVKKVRGSKLSGSSSSSEKNSRPRAEKVDSLSLPTGENKPPSDLSQYAIALFGEKGIGKTTLASSFPDSLVFMWEPRRRNLSIRQIPDPLKKEPQLTWQRFRAYQQMILEKSKPPRSVVIDTVDRAYDACFYDVCYRKGIKHPNEMKDYGQTWDEIRIEFEEVLNGFLYADIGCIFVSHAKLREVQTRYGQAFDQVTPTCKDKAWEYLKAVCDLAFYYGYEGQQRALMVRGNELIWAACGLEDHFLDPDGNQVGTILIGETPSEAYKNLLLSFNNKLHGYSPPQEKDTDDTENQDTEHTESTKRTTPNNQSTNKPKIRKRN